MITNPTRPRRSTRIGSIGSDHSLMVKTSDVFGAVSERLQDFVRVLAAFGRWRAHPGLGALHVHAWTQQALASQDRVLHFGDDRQRLDLFVGKALLDVE